MFSEALADATPAEIRAYLLAATCIIGAIGRELVSYLRTKDKSRVVKTDLEIKKEKDKRTADVAQQKLDQADADFLEDKRRMFINDLFEKYSEVQKRVDTLQEHVLRCETERAIALTQSHENEKRIEELRNRLEMLEGR